MSGQSWGLAGPGEVGTCPGGAGWGVDKARASLGLHPGEGGGLGRRQPGAVSGCQAWALASPEVNLAGLENP